MGLAIARASNFANFGCYIRADAGYDQPGLCRVPRTSCWILQNASSDQPYVFPRQVLSSFQLVIAEIVNAFSTARVASTTVQTRHGFGRMGVQAYYARYRGHRVEQ